MISPTNMNLNPIPSDTAIRDALAVLTVVSDADAQRTFLAAVVVRAEAQANAVLEAGRAELAAKQAAAESLMAAAVNSQAEADRQIDGAAKLRVALTQQHEDAMARATDALREAADLAAAALDSKAKYERLLADLKARVAA